MCHTIRCSRNHEIDSHTIDLPFKKRPVRSLGHAHHLRAIQVPASVQNQKCETLGKCQYPLAALEDLSTRSSTTTKVT